MKTVLLAVTGMSPQVITETLWAIHRNRGQEPWPAEIQIITTRPGGDKALQGLIELGHLGRLCAELGMPEPLFGPEQIHIVPDSNGVPVDDARSREDHEALADFIMRKVAELAKHPEIRIHASLAGGRKTMTYYFGYAMSLFGRPHDTLTHVLVTDGFEGLPDFYYPSKQQQKITSRDGRDLDPADAEIVLADIPFVRLSETLSPAMREIAETMTFRKLIVLLNLASNRDTIKITLDIPTQQVIVGSRIEPAIANVTIKSKPTFALLIVLVRAHIENDHSIQRYQLNPKTGKERPDIGLAGEIVNELVVLCGLNMPDKMVRLNEKIDFLMREYAELHEPLLHRTLASINNGVLSAWINPQLTSLKNRLELQLPLPLAHLLRPVGMRVDENGFLVEAKGEEAAYRFRLSPGQFSIREA